MIGLMQENNHAARAAMIGLMRQNNHAARAVCALKHSL